MGTHPLAGEYSNRTIFLADAIVRLDNVLDPKKPTSLELTSIVGGGDEEWSLQELHALGVCKNGELTSLLLSQYCEGYEKEFQVCDSKANLSFYLQVSTTTTGSRGSRAGIPTALWSKSVATLTRL